MAKFLTLINGVPRMMDINGAGSTIYDQTITVGVGGITASTPITLPAAQTYAADELQVYLGGLRQQVGLDYTYLGVMPRTQISMMFDLEENELLRLIIMNSNAPLYDEYITVGNGGVTTGTPITLPNSGSYSAGELQVYLNGQRMQGVLDYNYIGTVPRTQVSFTFDLERDDIVRFTIEP